MQTRSLYDGDARENLTHLGHLRLDSDLFELLNGCVRRFESIKVYKTIACVRVCVCV